MILHPDCIAIDPVPAKHSLQRKTLLWLFYSRNYSLNLCFANKYLYLYYSTPPPAFQGICVFFLYFKGGT